MNDFYVYALFRYDGRPFYIGKGRLERWSAHERRAFKEEGHKSRVARKTIERLGCIPKVKLAEGLSNEQAYAVEEIFIAAIGRHPDGPLTNHTKGGEGLVEPSDETRQRMRLSQLGKRMPQEVREKIGLFFRGRKLSAEHAEKLRISACAKPPEVNAKIGETMRKIWAERRRRREEA